MRKTFADRLAALEALEVEQEQSPAVAVEQLTEGDLIAAAVEGIRAHQIIAGSAEHQWLYGIDDYWRAVADRVVALCCDYGGWLHIVTPEERAIARAALASGAWHVRLRDARQGWWDFNPPVPYPAGCWETPEHQALKMTALALRIWFVPWGDELPLPATNAAVMAWLEG